MQDGLNLSHECLKSNPHTLPGITSFLAVLQANGRGYWDTSEENLERLRQLYTDVEVCTLGFTPSVQATQRLVLGSDVPA